MPKEARQFRQTSRPIAFLAVLVLHVALLALLVMAPRARNSEASPQFMELMMLPPATIPKVSAENNPPPRLRTRPVSIDLPVLKISPALSSPTGSPSGSPSAASGRGSGVNWTAEAHRAVQAFEIRRNQPQNSALSVTMPLDEWLTRSHQAGDRFKTDSGDWIVWINPDCYKLTSWHSGEIAYAAGPSPTVCRAPGAKKPALAAHGD